MPKTIYQITIAVLEEIDEDGVNLTDWEIDYIDKMMKERSHSYPMLSKIWQIYNDRVEIPQGRKPSMPPL